MLESVIKFIDFVLFYQFQDIYFEGFYIDYRWLNKEGIIFCYVFGYGFSYINFFYFDVKIEKVIQLDIVLLVCELKGFVLDYFQDILDYKEVLKFDGFSIVWCYIYLWFFEFDVKKVVVVVVDKGYVYFEGYNEDQKFGFCVGGG